MRVFHTLLVRLFSLMLLVFLSFDVRTFQDGYADGILDPFRPLCPPNLPLEMPKFTIGEIKAAIPKHCFERSLILSLGYAQILSH